MPFHIKYKGFSFHNEFCLSIRCTQLAVLKLCTKKYLCMHVCEYACVLVWGVCGVCSGYVPVGVCEWGRGLFILP